MSLTFKKVARENLSNKSVYVDDTTPTSPQYFRVSDVPEVLTKGKNLLRISAHPTNLVEGSQILVDVRDSNGNPIYFEIPNYLEDDKSRVISIWIYNDKGEDNTANGDATITLVATSKVGINGEPIPDRFKNKPNVRWRRTVNVDRNRKNTSEIIFKSDVLPSVSISESIDSYQNLPKINTQLKLVSSNLGVLLIQYQKPSAVEYIYKGNTPIVIIKEGSNTFNSEMIGYRIDFGMGSGTDWTPTTLYDNPLINTSRVYRTIKSLINNTTAVLNSPITTSFADREGLLHTYNFAKFSNPRISYFSTGSNISTENERSFANLTLSNVDPIAGVVDKIKVLIKSDGLPGEYELLNEVTVPFSSSFDIKIPIPSEHLRDPKLLKIQYLNSIGNISRTETITSPYFFEGGNYYLGGTRNLITGSMFIGNKLATGIELSGVSSGYIRSVGYDGLTSASLGKGPGGFIMYSGSGNLQIGEDTLNGVGLQLVSDNDERHLIFTTEDGGVLDVKTDKFFIGNVGSQFISASNGNIEISSSNFHLTSAGNVTMSGTITATAGTIGGFDITPTSIESSNGNIVLNGSAGTFVLSTGAGAGNFTSIDTVNRIIDGKNVARQLGYQLGPNSSTVLTPNYSSGDPITWTDIDSVVFKWLPGETSIVLDGMGTFAGETPSSGYSRGLIRLLIRRANPIASAIGDYSLSNYSAIFSSSIDGSYELYSTSILIAAANASETGGQGKIVIIDPTNDELDDLEDNLVLATIQTAWTHTGAASTTGSMDVFEYGNWSLYIGRVGMSTNITDWFSPLPGPPGGG